MVLMTVTASFFGFVFLNKCLDQVEIIQNIIEAFSVFLFQGKEKIEN